MKRLRNFLELVVETGIAARGFRLSKAVDRPEDIREAELFLSQLWRRA